jgi:hypothetical protein
MSRGIIRLRSVPRRGLSRTTQPPLSVFARWGPSAPRRAPAMPCLRAHNAPREVEAVVVACSAAHRLQEQLLSTTTPQQHRTSHGAETHTKQTQHAQRTQAHPMRKGWHGKAKAAPGQKRGRRQLQGAAAGDLILSHRLSAGVDQPVIPIVKNVNPRPREAAAAWAGRTKVKRKSNESQPFGSGLLRGLLCRHQVSVD